MELRFKKLDPKAVLPRYATEGSAGMDLCACLDAPLTLPNGLGTCTPISTGLAAAIPAGHVGLIFARSGLATKKGIIPANCVGVIDSDYRGEIKVALVNHGPEPYVIQPGERIAQMVITPVIQPALLEVRELDDTDRGAGGFGSTGK